MSRTLLLDTNIVVWLLLGDRARVSRTAVAAMEDETNEVAVSAASVWEIAIKRSLKADDRGSLGDCAHAPRLRPVVGHSFPLGEAPEAHRAIENRASVGKITLTF